MKKKKKIKDYINLEENSDKKENSKKGIAISNQDNSDNIKDNMNDVLKMKNNNVPFQSKAEQIEIKNDTTKQQIKSNAENIMKLNDDQINTLPYELAIKKDKRTYCQYYKSLVKTKHPIIFSFIHDGDYNSKIIKINLFFQSFVVYYTVTALFYNDDTMHQIYKKKGAYDLEYEIPKIIYSSLISISLNLPLKLLALSNDNILDFKNTKSTENIELKYKQLNDKLKIKFILYFIISFIFLILFWYYLSMFCAIYRNTQIHLIKDTLISFALSLIYPFAIYLLPGIFRIAALSNPKNKREYLYKFSNILQLF